LNSEAQPLRVVSVFPDEQETAAIGGLTRALSPDSQYLGVHGQQARDLLSSSQELIDALSHRTAEVRAGREILQRATFNDVVRACLPAAKAGERYLLVSPSTVPLDLAFDEIGNWGDRAIFSHLCFPQPPSDEVLARVLRPRTFPLEGYLLVCPMAMDRAVPRHLQDIVTVALSLESQMPVELWLQPRYDRALQALSRTDLSWLHIDTHGTQSQLMLGPSRADRRLAGAAELPPRVFTPLLLIVGCALLAGPDSVGSVLFRRGAETVFGPCAIFQSLGVANSEEGEAAWYRVFFESLLSGLDTGTSLLRARCSVQGTGILKYAYLLCGSSYVRFHRTGQDAEPGAAPDPAGR
jgi:hypothetical protein